MLSDRKPRPERPGAKSDNMPASSARSAVSARSRVDRRHDHITVVSAPVTANMPTSAVTNTDTQQQKNNIRHIHAYTKGDLNG